MKTVEEIKQALEIATDVSFRDQDDFVSPEVINTLRWVLDERKDVNFMYDPKKWTKTK